MSTSQIDEYIKWGGIGKIKTNVVVVVTLSLGQVARQLLPYNVNGLQLIVSSEQ